MTFTFKVIAIILNVVCIKLKVVDHTFIECTITLKIIECIFNV